MTWTPQGEARRYATDCDANFGLYSRFPIPVAAALWCAVPASKVQWILDTSSEVARGIFHHPEVQCLEPKCRALHEAIEAGQLPVYREQGGAVADYVKPERRHVSRDELKAWITKHYPSERPPGLFDDIERASHPSINADTYRAIKADHDAARAELEQARRWADEHMPKHQALKAERDSLLGECQSLRAMVESKPNLDPREETTYLNVIGALLALLLGKSASGERNSAFSTQSAIIAALLDRFEGRPGISKRTLEDKLPKARKSLDTTGP